MNNQNISEEERHEAATEEAATLESVGKLKFEGEGEQRNVPLAHFPSGADGTERLRSEVEVENSTVNLNLKPQAKVSEEARQKLEQSVIRMRQKLTQIADLARTAEAKSNSEHVKLGSKYLENAKALCEIRNIASGHDKPLDPTAPEIERGKVRLFKSKRNSACHGTYIYDRICINDARIRATLHPDNGGLEQHATIWIGDSQRCFCYCTFNTTSPVKCDYVVRGMLVGIAKRLVYHHKNRIKRKAKWAAAKQQAHDNKGDAV